MAEAFGPYTSHDLRPMRQRPPLAQRIYSVMLAVAIGVVLALLLVHHLAK